MFRKLAAILALLFALTACTANTAAAPAPAESPAPAAAEVMPAVDTGADLWPAVDNQLDALTQCFLYLPEGAEQDACVSAVFVAFPLDTRPIEA